VEQIAVMFAISKIVGFFAQPSTLIWVLLIVGLTRARSLRPLIRQQGLKHAFWAASFLLIVGITPVSTWVLAPLEERFPRLDPPVGATDIAGIIVLGGGEDGPGSVHRRQLQINAAGDRITEATALAVRFPEARLVVSGTNSTLLVSEPQTASPLRDYFVSVGVGPERIVIEGHSRNTYENATLTRAMVKPKVGEHYILVTSAAHMPRAVGAFRKAGFDVMPYPTDYRTNLPMDALHPFHSIPEGLKRFDDATKEWLGLVAYRLLGRTTSFFPAPAIAGKGD